MNPSSLRSHWYDFRFVSRFAASHFVRDWRSGELRVVALALLVAVAAVSAVNFFTDRVERGLTLYASQLLGGDLLLRDSAPIPQPLRQRADELGLRSVDLVQFPSVIFNRAGATQLVAVKAISPGYPLRGELRLDAAIEPGQIPARGEVWLEPRLFALLGIAPGDWVALGEREFRATRAILHEPDRAGLLFQLAPRVLLNLADLPATALLHPASRASYRLQLAGEVDAVLALRAFVDTLRASDEAARYDSLRFEDVRNGRPELRRALRRAEQFLGLTAVVCVLLAGAAIAVAAHGFVARQADVSALLRTFGATRWLVWQFLLLRLLALTLTVSALGIALGYIVQWALVAYFGRALQIALPVASGWRPIFFGQMLGLGLPAGLRPAGDGQHPSRAGHARAAQ